MRQKKPIDGKATDRELFDQLEFSDPWVDAKLPEVFLYLLTNDNLQIPDSWHSSIMRLKMEVELYVHGQHLGQLMQLQMVSALFLQAG